MRQFNSLFREQLDKQHGSEPMVFVEVDWVEGTTISYSDRKIGNADYPKPALVSVSDVRTSVTLSSSASNTQISVTLDDIDGSIRDILDRYDVHGRNARISLGYEDIPFSARETFVSGVIASPMQYDDASKSFSFDILSEFNTREVAFAMEDGNFPFVPEDQRNKVWPLVFGEVCHMPTVKIETLLQGRLKEGVGVKDPTLESRICQANNIVCPKKLKLEPLSSIQQGIEAVINDPNDNRVYQNKNGFERRNNGSIDPMWPDGRQILQFYQQSGLNQPHLGDVTILNENGQIISEADCDQSTKPQTPTGPGGGPPLPGAGGDALLQVYENQLKFWFATCRAENGYVKVLEDDLACQTRRLGIICQLAGQKTQQDPLDATQMTIEGGEDFPQNVPITIRVKDIRFEGTMLGQLFNITKVIPPEEIDNPPCITFGDSVNTGSGTEPIDSPDCQAQIDSISQVSGGASESFRYFEQFESIGFKWLPPGSIVTLEDSSVVVHIASLHLSVVNSVAAYRTFGESKVLMEIPSDRYTVEFIDYGDYTTTEIHLVKSLSSYPGETWDDTVYVSLESSLPRNITPTVASSNVAGVIRTLVEDYTDLTIDNDSFLAVENLTLNYPMNFYIQERRDVLSIIRDLAYQARCAVSINNGVVNLTYLSAEPTESRVLTDDDILLNTFNVSLTETEDLVTRQNITWKKTDAPITEGDDIDLQLVLRHNISKYGVIQEDFDFFGMNTFDLIQKTGTFWLTRRSNTWKLVEFQTPMKHVDLDIYDSVTLQVDEFPPVKCIIQEMDFNQQANSIRFKCWTPVLSGTDEQYIWGYPATQDEFVTFPLQQIQDAGDGLGLNVRPPDDHPLAIGFTEQRIYNTSGDRFPSDIGDVFSQVVCDDPTEFTLSDSLEPEIIDFDLSGDVSNANLDATERDINSGAGNGTIKNPDGIEVDDPEAEPPEIDNGFRNTLVITPPLPLGIVNTPDTNFADNGGIFDIQLIDQGDNSIKHVLINNSQFGQAAGNENGIAVVYDPEPLLYSSGSYTVTFDESIDCDVSGCRNYILSTVRYTEVAHTPEVLIYDPEVPIHSVQGFFPYTFELTGGLSYHPNLSDPMSRSIIEGLIVTDMSTSQGSAILGTVFLFYLQPVGFNAFHRKMAVADHSGSPLNVGTALSSPIYEPSIFWPLLGALNGTSSVGVQFNEFDIPAIPGQVFNWYVQRFMFNSNISRNDYSSTIAALVSDIRSSAVSVPDGQLLLYGSGRDFNVGMF